ncbi:MAG: flagellar basal body L-ring protein FlgH [Paracoccaceae bacterium]|nr:flagellar basal body L-ring protein FlgH [Paracoccaceae bacterium]
MRGLGVKSKFILPVFLIMSGCARMESVGQEPEITPVRSTIEHTAMMTPSLPQTLVQTPPIANASLWSGGRESLFGDKRAATRGDILTVVIEIDDKAEISNSSNRARSGSENLSVPSLFGIPQRVDPSLPEGATLSEAVSLNSSSASSGNGSVSRNEKLTLRVAATVVDVLPNGVLSIQGTQEVRVNFELRELLVSGFVRPKDITRQNEITYDKIASARVSYGGRGQISDMQQPRYGQQIADIILPF